jgi:SAM-dependent methyltransferase
MMADSPDEKTAHAKIDYEALARTYARFREASPRIIASLAGFVNDSGSSVPRILEIGCGTGDHLAALADLFGPLGGRAAGFDISPGMLEQARAKHPQVGLSLGDAEKAFPYENGQFDMAFSVNVIHYIKDLDTHFREARRVLRPGGVVVTVTDSEEDIRARTMTRYFPDTIAPELERYHPVTRLTTAMETAGFIEIAQSHTRHASHIGPADMDRFRERMFSALRLIPDEAHERGMAKLEADFASGRPELLELYTYIAGRA